MNGSLWIHDPWSNKRHHPDCTIWNGNSHMCNCAELDDEMVEEFQRVKPYTRTQTVPLSAPQGPYQSLASLIRSARRQGLLRPVQNYTDRAVPASRP